MKTAKALGLAVPPLLLARAERIGNIRDADVGLRMSSEARRLIGSLRRHAPPKPPGPSLYDRLEAAQRAGGDDAPAK